MYKHILIPVDLADTASAARAVDAARHIARRDGARMTVFTVVPTWPLEVTRAPRDQKPDLDAYIETIRGGDDIVGVLETGGSISGRIIEAAETRHADLIVMAAHDPRITDYLIGSNAAHVALHSPCSVMVVRGKGSGVFGNLLVPVDLDYPRSSAKALDLATAMARAEAAKVTVVSVQPILIDETGAPPPDYQPKLDAFLAKRGGISGVLKLGGSVSGEIRYTAEEIGADLIVIGSHDPHFTDYLIGSNAAHVALHSPCSVMVVR